MHIVKLQGLGLEKGIGMGKGMVQPVPEVTALCVCHHLCHYT